MAKDDKEEPDPLMCLIFAVLLRRHKQTKIDILPLNKQTKSDISNKH